MMSIIEMTALHAAQAAENDKRANLRPSADALVTAGAILSTTDDVDRVIFPVAFPGKDRGVWVPGQEVITIATAPIPSGRRGSGQPEYALARDVADSIAKMHLIAAGQLGTTGWVVIERGGDWRVVED